MGQESAPLDHKPDHSQSQTERLKLKRKDYEKALRGLQAELCSLQDWVKETGERIILVFEGRDAAGKGGTIKAITERVSPRTFRLVRRSSAKNRKCTCSAISRISRRLERS